MDTHRFNDNGTKGLFTEINYSPMIKITDRAKKEIICAYHQLIQENLV